MLRYGEIADPKRRGEARSWLPTRRAWLRDDTVRSNEAGFNPWINVFPSSPKTSIAQGSEPGIMRGSKMRLDHVLQVESADIGKLLLRWKVKGDKPELLSFHPEKPKEGDGL